MAEKVVMVFCQGLIVTTLIVGLLGVVVFLLVHLVRLSTGAKEQQLQQQQELQAAVRRARFAIDPEAKKKVEGSLFVILRRDGRRMTRAGVGFFVDSRRAVICDHIIPESVKVGGFITVEFPTAKKQMRLKIIKREKMLDFAILISEEEDAPAFLQPYRGSVDDLVGQNMVLCAFQLALDEEMEGETYHVGYMRATGSKLTLHQNRLIYESNLWLGDSGGALVLFDGEVVGMHQESINGIREFRRQGEVLLEDEVTLDWVSEMALSLGSVLDSTAQGGIALLSHVFDEQ